MDPIFVQKLAVAKSQLVVGDDVPEGTFEAIVSVFGNKDNQGDVVENGAFKKTLGAWQKAGKPIPAIWSHQFHNPDMFLGKYTEAGEEDGGLRLKGRLNLAWPVAQRVYELYKEDLVGEFSWSGRVLDYARIEKGDEFFDEENPWKNGARIKQIDLWEAGPTFKGANSETQLLGVKASAGLSVARKGEALTPELLEVLRDVREKIGSAIDLADTSKTDQTETGSSGVSNTDDRTRKSAVVLSPRTRALLALQNINR